MRLAAIALLSLLAGCRAGAAGADAGSFRCPDAPPTSGDPCDAIGAACTYDRCATEGVIGARCDAADAGTGAWSVASTPCAADCRGDTCDSGQVCAVRIGGALISGCTTHACGEGPLTCECACGAGQRCEIYLSPREDALFGCYVDCGADVCP